MSGNTDLVALFGTPTPPPVRESIVRGPVHVTLEDGTLRHLKIGGVEILRQAAFLVRDRDWGRVTPTLAPARRDDSDDALVLTQPMVFRTATGALDVTITATLRAHSLTLVATGQVTGLFDTNRSGFTLLYPINGMAGARACVTHSDGSQEDKCFPDVIAPWQPFEDIAALTHQANGLAVTCAFAGDVFEMEDQRQWGDASFKIYNRPLARPWPYRLAQGAFPTQTMSLTWQAAPKAAQPRPAGLTPALTDQRFAQTALVLDSAQAARAALSPQDLVQTGAQRVLCHLDATANTMAAQMDSFARLQSACPDLAFDLELLGRFDASQTPEEELTAHRRAMDQAGLSPASVFICPAVDRQSTPPGSTWPDCPPLVDIHSAAALVFADVPRGAGMASFFPELNRKRPPRDGALAQELAFITHGLCPIVHAADDVSVLETLEAIPHIARSARAIAGARGYRIGPCTLAMRQNPYGNRTLPNPNLERICMADIDPRHFAAFGAAYLVGLASALAPFAPQVWTPAALYGPRGLLGAGPVPLAGVVRWLAERAGGRVEVAQIDNAVATLVISGERIVANLSGSPCQGLGPFEVTK
ncbi:hypothetical protein AQS8620_00828 [Aquimixticola soesokkakensis]|uniref:Uncharacterized protein n=1 Tax=Aquimixticola soesokkakensis TaxID=1519096 RepID=A0A1Y5RWI8_9RHOB|nr:hypothetical protein [Aquimixticola soesokkakensis]SLN27146.1 hypothetical protein AQS8620_00828 [Aquimixticola soesokkakensis]